MTLDATELEARCARLLSLAEAEEREAAEIIAKVHKGPDSNHLANARRAAKHAGAAEAYRRAERLIRSGV